MKSRPSGAEHAQNYGDHSGIQEKPHNTAHHRRTHPHGICCGNTQVSGIHNSKGPKVAVFPAPAQEACNLPQELLIQFYTAIIQPVPCSLVTLGFGSATEQDRSRVQEIVRTAENWSNLPSIQGLYTSRVRIRKHHYRPITPWTKPVQYSVINNTKHPLTSIIDFIFTV